MSKVQLLDEDDLGLPHGVFAGSRIPPRLADAATERLEKENKRKSGLDFLSKSVPAGLIGILIGFGLSIWVMMTVQWSSKPMFIVGGFAGFGLGIAITLLIQRVPGWGKHCWNVLWHKK